MYSQPRGYIVGYKAPSQVLIVALRPNLVLQIVAALGRTGFDWTVGFLGHPQGSCTSTRPIIGGMTTPTDPSRSRWRIAEGVPTLNIGEAAHASGISAKIIRYYEAIGLIHTAKRRPSGYRRYEAPDVHRLRVIRIAQNSGFSLASIREILALWDDRKKSSAEIKVLAQAKIVELQSRLMDIDAMIGTLKQLATVNTHRGGWTSVPSRAHSRPRKRGR